MGTPSQSQKRQFQYGNFRQAARSQPAERPAFVRRPLKAKRPSASTPSPTACAPAALSSRTKTPRTTPSSGTSCKPTGTSNPHRTVLPGNPGHLQWLLKRVAESERRIYDGMAFSEKQLVMLACVAKQRAQLERSFRTAIADMKQSQKERSQQQARQPQPAQTAQPASAPVHPSAGPQRSSVLPSPPTPVSNLPP